MHDKDLRRRAPAAAKCPTARCAQSLLCAVDHLHPHTWTLCTATCAFGQISPADLRTSMARTALQCNARHPWPHALCLSHREDQSQLRRATTLSPLSHARPSLAPDEYLFCPFTRLTGAAHRLPWHGRKRPCSARGSLTASGAERRRYGGHG